MRRDRWQWLWGRFLSVGAGPRARGEAPGGEYLVKKCGLVGMTDQLGEKGDWAASWVHGPVCKWGFFPPLTCGPWLSWS